MTCLTYPYYPAATVILMIRKLIAQVDSLDALKLWSRDNQLFFNFVKCCYLHINSSHDLNLFLDNADIVKQSSVADLGIQIH